MSEFESEVFKRRSKRQKGHDTESTEGRRGTENSGREENGVPARGEGQKQNGQVIALRVPACALRARRNRCSRLNPGSQMVIMTI